MAHIVVITHEYDRLVERKFFRRSDSGYMIHAVLEDLRSRGHTWTIAHGPSNTIKGDVAVLHVDATRVDPAYVEYGSRFPLCLNLAVTDISKGRISEARVAPGDGWTGPIIVKPLLNSGGVPEERLNRRALRVGKPLPFPTAKVMKEYRVFDRAPEVPPGFFADPDLLVERFMPEVEEDGFALRFWVFCGDYDFCGRFISRTSMVKGPGVFRSERCPVPEDLRLRREQLGFDYGKFDFAVHDGKSYLMDANKTPGRVPKSAGEVASMTGMASAFEKMIRNVLG
ncbi:hypothetical protein [Mesorhizobium sp. B2-3-4]|uniref:hypothetical protein n=1 Tax=Mesorhizobium sp. B2-3-4 TaxID=2589959 RepID=UPI0011272697|nr:hypothetical protein [Mesorhizobium sp. B2-3-4]TPM38494.1 hypothetical protein FJ967_11245 [Mesorhizobium sp. B2-3-4]